MMEHTRTLNTPRSRGQRGAFIAILPLAIIAVLGIIGLALTSGHAFVDRAKLQNILDAMALTTAITVNQENVGPNPANKCNAAETSLQTLFHQTVAPRDQVTPEGPNKALATLLDTNGDGNTDVTLEYSTDPARDPTSFSETCPTTTPTQYIYTRTWFSGMDAPEFLVQILGPWIGGTPWDMRVSGTAVAGPATVQEPSCPLPIFLCNRETGNPADPCPPGDNNLCFGHQKYRELCGKTGPITGGPNAPPDCSPDVPATGNFGFLDWDGSNDGGSSDLENRLRGSRCEDSCPANPPEVGNLAPTETGNKESATRNGINARFFASDEWPPQNRQPGQYNDGVTCPGEPEPDDSTPVPPDPVRAPWNAAEDTKTNAGMGYGPDFPGAGPGTTAPDKTLINEYMEALEAAGRTTADSKRLVRMPVVSPPPGETCPPAGQSVNMRIDGYACVLLTRPVLDLTKHGDTEGADTTTSIVAEIVDSTYCATGGPIGPNESRLYRVILYKDLATPDT